MEQRPMDVLVIAGEIDTEWSMGEMIFTSLLKIRDWVMKKNIHNTCVFSTIPTIPHDVKGATPIQLLRARTHDLNDRIIRYNQKEGFTPPKFNTWGVRETGYGKETTIKFKKGDWEEILLGENTRGCNSLCFRKQKIITQGRVCMTWF